MAKVLIHIRRLKSTSSDTFWIIIPINITSKYWCTIFRFEHLFDNKELVTASCLHPLFKFDWISDENTKEEAKNNINEILRQSANKTLPNDDPEKPSISFFNFPKRRCLRSECQELSDFIVSTSESLAILNSYPNLKKLFIKYNTVLPSSASVERLFSAAGLILTFKKFKLSDDSFEKQLLLKINKKYVE